MLPRLQREIAQVKDWLSIEWLPGYATEFNDIERDRKYFKEHYLAHQTFIIIDRMERAIHTSVSDIRRHRRRCGQH